jgi:flagellar biosynthesis/type III secretory pathway protein FliH
MTTHLDLNDLRDQARKLAELRREARRDRERYAHEQAQAERDYRMLLARTFAEKRAEGEAQGAAEIFARGVTAEVVLRRDMAAAMVKSCDLRIEELEADRAMLRQIGDWSMRLEGLPQPQWTEKVAA